MSFLMIGDNRTSGNWGGRSGSIALFSLLRESLGAGTSVFAAELLLATSGYGYRSRIFPSSKTWLAQQLAAKEPRNPILRNLIRLDKRLGGTDFLGADPEESVRNLLAWRSRDPGLQSLYERVESADIVVINGEGDVVFGSPVRRQILFFMAMIHLARALRKPVVFVNAMLSDCSLTGRDEETFAAVARGLRLCDLVTLRDEQSLRLAREEMGIADCRLIPDSLFAWYDLQIEAREQLPRNGDFLVPQPELEQYLGRLDFSGDYICVGGNSLVTRPGQREKVIAGYRRILAELPGLGLPVYVAVTDGPDSFLADLAAERGCGVIPLTTPIHLAAAALGRARLVVSGRYHPTIMAALGGTPAIFLATNAHKMRSLANLLEYESCEVYPPDLDETAARRLVEACGRYLAAGAPLRRRIQATARRRALETRRLGPLIAAVGKAQLAARA